MSHFQLIVFSLILGLLILLAAFFACAETALMAVNRYRLRHKARMKKRYAMRLLQLLKRPDRLLGAILIGSTFANMLASSLATLIAFHFWGEHGALIAAFLLAVAVLIFAEIMPKTVAALYPDKLAQLVTYPIQAVLKILYPAVLIANYFANGMLRLLHVSITSKTIEPLSREELRSVVYDATGKISRQYQNMLLNILDLSKLIVNDVMIPRYEIHGIDMEKSLETIIERLHKFRSEWVPVYRENINNVIGVLYTHDVLRYLLNKHSLSKELLEEFLQEPYFVPIGTPLNIQLGYFLQNQNKIAFVVDEYGEIQGSLTLNDILEEIVGDFTSGMNRKRLQQQADNSYLVDGAITIREFNRVSGWNLPLREARTVNGLIIECLEALPHAGTTVLVAKHPIEIIHVKENRVKQARIFPELQE